MSKKIEKLDETNPYVEQTLISLPQSLDLPTEFSVGICTIILLVINLPTNHRKCSIGESIVGNFLSIGKSIGNKKILVSIDLLIEKASKKKLPASFRQYFSRQNIVCNFVSNYLKIFKKNIF
jgi:hypothetical protein